MHRALPDAETCARVLCALLPRLNAVASTVGEALAVLRPKGGKGPRRRAPGAKRPRDQRPDLSKLPNDPGVYIFRDSDGHPLYVGKSVCLRTRARAHFTTPVAWTGQAEHVDYQPTESELGALLLENRLIKRLRPPGNVNLKKSADGYVYLRCRLDIPYPILEVAREPAPGHAVCVGPVRGRAAAAELVEQLNSLFGLRHCGRGMPRRQWPSAYGQMGRCLSPCLGDLDPNLYRARLEEALRLFEVDGSAALLAHVDAQIARGVAGEGLRARGVAAAAAQAAGLAARPPRRRAARRPRRDAARVRAAPERPGALGRVLDRRRARGRLGPGAVGPRRDRGAHARGPAQRAAAGARRLAAGRGARRGADRRACGWRGTTRCAWWSWIPA